MGGIASIPPAALRTLLLTHQFPDHTENAQWHVLTHSEGSPYVEPERTRSPFVKLLLRDVLLLNVFLGDFFARTKKSPGRHSRTEALLLYVARGRCRTEALLW